MPQSTRQTQGEIIHELRKEGGLITAERLEEVMADAGINSQPTVTAYKKALVKLNLLELVAGGYKLTPKARTDYAITIWMPLHNKGEVIKGLTAAMQQFKPLTTIELE